MVTRIVDCVFLSAGSGEPDDPAESECRFSHAPPCLEELEEALDDDAEARHEAPVFCYDQHRDRARRS